MKKYMKKKGYTYMVDVSGQKLISECESCGTIIEIKLKDTDHLYFEDGHKYRKCVNELLKIIEKYRNN